MNYQKIGNLISKLRKEKGLTQKELAEKLFITDRAVSKWERGLGCPDVSLLDDLSKILDVSIIEILQGEKLNQEELLKNENIIKSMNYFKDNLKTKLKKYFNIFCILIILLISSIIIVNNFKSSYYLTKTYNNTSDNKEIKALINKTNNNIIKIETQQGNYEKADYDVIISFTKKLKEDLKKENNLYYVEKKSYSYLDFIKYYELNQNFLYLNSLTGAKEIYKIIQNYDLNIIDSIGYYYSYTNILMSENQDFSKKLINPYIYGAKIDSSFVTEINNYIKFKYYRDNMLLENIMKAGGINE